MTIRRHKEVGFIYGFQQSYYTPIINIPRPTTGEEEPEEGVLYLYHSIVCDVPSQYLNFSSPALVVSSSEDRRGRTSTERDAVDCNQRLDKHPAALFRDQ